MLNNKKLKEKSLDYIYNLDVEIIIIKIFNKLFLPHISDNLLKSCISIFEILVI